MRPFPGSIKGVIFDLDGTIVDRDRLVVHCTLKVSEKLMGKAPNQDRISWGLHETETIRRPALQTSGDSCEHALDIYTRCLHANLNMIEVFPGIRALLENLRSEGKPAALVTSVPDGSFVRAVLEFVGAKHWFKSVVTGEDVKRPKPDPEGIRLSLRALGVPQGQILMVGDSAADIQAGRDAGVITGAALWARKDLRDLWGPLASRARPDFKFQTVAELSNFLFRRRATPDWPKGLHGTC